MRQHAISELWIFVGISSCGILKIMEVHNVRSFCWSSSSCKDSAKSQSGSVPSTCADIASRCSEPIVPGNTERKSKSTSLFSCLVWISWDGCITWAFKVCQTCFEISSTKKFSAWTSACFALKIFKLSSNTITGWRLVFAGTSVKRKIGHLYKIQTFTEPMFSAPSRDSQGQWHDVLSECRIQHTE